MSNAAVHPTILFDDEGELFYLIRGFSSLDEMWSYIDRFCEILEVKFCYAIEPSMGKLKRVMN